MTYAPAVRVSVFPSLAGYRRANVRDDLIAGLTVWAVLVPEALAYATIAGVSPVVGLYAAPPALVLYAAFGSSRHLVVGPMAATAALSAAIVADVATDGSFAAMTAALAIVTGLIALLAGLLRLGFLANFISEPVLKGFIVGLALTIIVGQIPKLLGIEKGEGNFFEQLWDVITSIGQTHLLTLVIGLSSLLVVLGFRRYAPVVPGSLVAVILGIVAVATLDLQDHGVAIVGHIDAGLPSLGLPDVALSDSLGLVASAVGVMLIGFAEGLGAAKTYATRNHYEIDPNRELIGLGASNVGAGLSSGMVVNGSLSKTAVNGSAGARSQVSGLIVAVLTVVTLLFLTPLFEDLPEATLAAIVIAALIELVDVPTLVRLYRTYSERLIPVFGPAARADFIAAVAALLGVLVFDTLPGLFIGIASSLLLLIYRASRPRIARLGRVPGTPSLYADVERHPEFETVDGVVILRVEGALFFADAEHVRAALLSAGSGDGTTSVILDAETIPAIDITAVEMLRQVRGELEARGVRLLLAHDIGQIRDLLEDEPHDRAWSYRTVEEAVRSATDPTA